MLGQCEHKSMVYVQLTKGKRKLFTQISFLRAILKTATKQTGKRKQTQKAEMWNLYDKIAFKQNMGRHILPRCSQHLCATSAQFPGKPLTV